MQFDAIYIFSQILAFLSLILMIFAYQQKNKPRILKFTLTSDALYAIHYIILGAWSGVATKLISVIRDFYIIYKGKEIKKIAPLMIFICAYVVVSITTFSSFLSILPLCASVVYSIGIYNGNEQRMRITTIICCMLWLIYNISVFSVAGMMSDISIAISNVIAYCRYRKSRIKK